MAGLIVLLCLVLVCEISAIWDNGTEDDSFSHLGLHTMNMMCNDEGSVCQTCFTSPAHGEVFLHVIKYTTEPYTLEYTTQMGLMDDKIKFQELEEQGDAYRVCADMELDGRNLFVWKLNICIDNDLRDVSVPSDCARPLAMVTLQAERPPDGLRGHELLLCAA